MRKSENNTREYGDTPLGAVQCSSLWVLEVDIGAGVPGKPEEAFKMFYATSEAVWGKELQFRGTRHQ